MIRTLEIYTGASNTSSLVYVAVSPFGYDCLATQQHIRQLNTKYEFSEPCFHITEWHYDIIKWICICSWQTFLNTLRWCCWTTETSEFNNSALLSSIQSSQCSSRLCLSLNDLSCPQQPVLAPQHDNQKGRKHMKLKSSHSWAAVHLRPSLCSSCFCRTTSESPASKWSRMW